MSIAFITLSEEGALLIPGLRREFGKIKCFVHELVPKVDGTQSFSQITVLTQEIFLQYRQLIYAVPCGVVVRALANCPVSKLTDPAIVVTDVGARWAISLLSGHEGGGNNLAVRVANIFDAEPVITTTTDAAKDLIVGIGCRKNVECDQVIWAIQSALESVGATLGRVRLLASAEVKSKEAGLLQASAQLCVPIRFISIKQLQQCSCLITESEFVRNSIGVPAVAEPSALIAGRRTTLLLPKTIFDHITIAIAQESFTS